MADRIDLRSDTATRPTEAMRRAMASAEVADDWFGEDPTVNRLQDLAAEITGMEAALYLPTGTLCNQIALHALARSGHLVVCESSAHVCNSELRAAAVLSGIAFRGLDGERGTLSPDQVAAALAPDRADVTVVDLVAIENTHQIAGGTVTSVAEVAAVAKVCADAGVPLYLDGARIFNACTVAGAEVFDYARQVTAMMFCLSKGLGAPVGSVLAGDREFIREARRLKILFGAAWRQAGILAAAGIIALQEGPKRLTEDHEHAQILAHGLAELLPGSVDPSLVATNIVFVDVTATGRSAFEWQDRLAAEGLIVSTGSSRVRMLTHRDVGRADIDAALDIWRRVAAAG
jgi:threonine aldolase